MNFNWTYIGVNHSLAGNGGPECVNYINSERRCWETCLVGALAVFYMNWGCNRLYVPKQLTRNVEQRDRFGKRMLLVLMCMTFGCEIGFKLSTKTLIYLLNPCHVITVLQIYLLASPPHRHVTTVFRCHLHCLNGAMLAILFPVLNTRMLPFEKEVYYMQHVMMLVIPFYLLRVGGVYTIERIGDFSWTICMLGAILLYHFVTLQALGLITQVNLNNMLCPAVSDPFRGPNYRMWAVAHQSLLIGIFAKVYIVISWGLLVLVGHKGILYHPEELPIKNSSNGKALSAEETNTNNIHHSHSSSFGFWSKFMKLWNYEYETMSYSKLLNGHTE